MASLTVLQTALVPTVLLPARLLRSTVAVPRPTAQLVLQTMRRSLPVACSAIHSLVVSTKSAARMELHVATPVCAAAISIRLHAQMPSLLAIR